MSRQRAADNPVILEHVTEKQFQNQVIELAKLKGYAVYHTYNSRRSEKGFPDLFLARPRTDRRRGRVILIELKTEKGKRTPEQEAWAKIIWQTGQAEYFCFRPSDWPVIEKVLE